MALSQDTEDALLAWLLGAPFPAPSAQTWLALHDGDQPAAVNEIKGWAGGDRLLISADDFSAPTAAPGGGRQRVNTRALLLGVHSAAQTVRSFALWNAPVGGSFLVGGAVSPALTVQVGDPPVFLTGCLALRSL